MELSMSIDEKEFAEGYANAPEENKEAIRRLLSCPPQVGQLAVEFVSFYGKLPGLNDTDLMTTVAALLRARGFKDEWFIMHGMYMLGWWLGIRSERARRKVRGARNTQPQEAEALNV